MNEEKGILWTTRVSLALAGLVLACAAVLGYTALADLFRAAGLFADWLAWLFPVLFDAMEVAAAVAVFNARLQGEEDRFAWRLVVSFTILGVQANCLHAMSAFIVGRVAGWQMLLAMGMTSLFPVSVALAVHLSKKVIERHMARVGRTARLADLAQKEWALVEAVGRLAEEERTLRDAVAPLREGVGTGQTAEKARLQRVFLDYLASHPRSTLAEAGAVVGREPSTVKGWAKELRDEGRLDRNGHGWEVIP